MTRPRPDNPAYTDTENITLSYITGIRKTSKRLFNKQPLGISFTSNESLNLFVNTVETRYKQKKEASELIFALAQMLSNTEITFDALSKNKSNNELIKMLANRFEMTTAALFALEQRQVQTNINLSVEMIQTMTQFADMCMMFSIKDQQTKTRQQQTS